MSMKASAFTYARATSVESALDLLLAHGEKAKILAGGQSLMPAMNLRLISPELIIDIGEIAELRGISWRNGRLRIGALVRHADLLKSPEVAKHAPLLIEATNHIAHPAIRNRGTFGGSLAHADPAAELPACMVALDATIMVRGLAGERQIAAVDFFKGVFETALSPHELLVGAEIPAAAGHSADFFQELSRRHGDYALAGLAAHAVLEGDRFSALRMAFFAIGVCPVLARAPEMLIDVIVTPELLAAASTLLDEELACQDDLQASRAMRRHLARLLFTRGVSRLLGRPDLSENRTDA